MINCQTVTELVTDYLEGKLSLWDRLHFWMHVGMCKHCREYLRQMKQTMKVLGKVPEDSIPTDVHDKLMELLKHPQRPSSILSGASDSTENTSDTANSPEHRQR